ncbi:MAG: LytR C-terminal domain-containing protein [Actinomycetes bacterium]
MSMMTPRGFDPRRSRGGRHVLRHAIVLTLAVLLLVGAGFSAWWFALRDTTTSVAAVPNCPVPTVTVTAKPVALPPAKVKVNVYNAGCVAGLAGRVSKDLTARGFQVAEVANDPKKAALTTPVELRFGPTGYAAAQTLLTEVKNAHIVVDDRANAIVDVVLGDSFTSLVPAPTAAKALATATVSPSTNAARTSPAPSSTAGSGAASSPSPTPSPVGTGADRCVPQPTATVTADPFRSTSPSAPATGAASAKPSVAPSASSSKR